MPVVATAGHVDHGKSTLVWALTGTDPDRWAEEKRRGLTIDLGFAHTTLDTGVVVGFVDVPGHVRFLGNMLAGVGDVDACLFVVAATEGWKSQSEDHLRILELLGVTSGVIALTKVDLVDERTRSTAERQVRDCVAHTFLADAPIVAVSAPAGQNIDELRCTLTALLGSVPPAVDASRPRLWVDRAFAVTGSGTVVTGTLTGGGISIGDQLVVGPRSLSTRVRSIQSYGLAVRRALPGSRVALNLAGVGHRDVQRGDAVYSAAQWLPTKRFDVSLTVLADLGHDVEERGAYVLHVGSGDFPASIRPLAAKRIAPSSTEPVRVRLARRLPLLPGDRFVLRESGRSETVGGGEVLDVHPVLPPSKARPDSSVDRLIRERGWTTPDELRRLTGETRPANVGRWIVDHAELGRIEQALAARIEQAGPEGLDVSTFDEREREVLARLTSVVTEGSRARGKAFDAALSEHPYVVELRRHLLAPPPPPAEMDRGVLRQLVQSGTVYQRDGVYFHEDSVSRARDVVRQLSASHPTGFTMSELRDALGVSRKYALALAAELDARGFTRRRDALRLPGPRLGTSDD